MNTAQDGLSHMTLCLFSHR